MKLDDHGGYWQTDRADELFERLELRGLSQFPNFAYFLALVSHSVSLTELAGLMDCADFYKIT